MSIKLLALDTATEACSVALMIDDTIEEKFILAPQKHTQLILPMIDEILANAQIKITDLNAIAVSRGPGSFTGVRIGIAVTQGLAFAAGLPVIPVSTLAALGQGAYRQYQAAKILTGIDARMQEIYLAGYEIQQRELVNVIDECVISANHLTISLDSSWVAVGTAWDVNNQFLLSKNLPQQHIYAKFYPHAQDIVTLAKMSYLQNQTINPENITPTYLRDKVTSAN